MRAEPIGRHCLAMFVGLAVVAVLTVMGPSLEGPMTVLAIWVTKVLVTLIHAAGMEAVRQATIITHPDGFACNISYRCTGLLPIAFLAASILASRGSIRQKLLGIACGIPLVIVLNFARLLHLFYVGVYVPTALYLLHNVIWQGLILIGTFSLWLVWARWARSPVPDPCASFAQGWDSTDPNL